MSSRFFIPVLCIGAVAFACGPRAHNETAAAKKTGTPTAQAVSRPTEMRPDVPASVVAKVSKTPVSAQVYVRKDEANILLALRVVNTGKKRVEITFPSGQTYDFAVLDSTGRELWRWGSNRMFTQALRNKLLGAGETMDFEETLKSAPLPPGRYTARATLTSENYPLVGEAAFIVTGTTIASR